MSKQAQEEQYKDSERIYWTVTSEKAWTDRSNEDEPFTYEVNISTSEYPESSIGLLVDCCEDRPPTGIEIANALSQLSTKLVIMLVEKEAMRVAFP